MFKRNILAILVPALLAANAANALEIYNKDGHQLDLYGKADVRHAFSGNDREDGDLSYIQLGLKGETQIADDLSGYANWEYEVNANSTESRSHSGSRTRLAFAGLKFADYGSFDYGRNYGLIYDVNRWTDIQPIFGGDTIFNPDNFMTSRATGVATYRNNNLFGLAEGLNVALQYQGANRDNRDLKNQNGEGVAVSSTYDLGYGVAVGAAYSSSKRTDEQRASYAKGKKAEAWNIGAKYDVDELYLAAMYAETRNMTPYGRKTDHHLPGEMENSIASKTKNIELIARYRLDFGLQPFVGFVQSKGKGLGANGAEGNQDLLKYMTVGSSYNFNKNLSAYVNYKINLLDKNAFTEKNGLNTKDVVGIGVLYQF
ncbi:Outer membrane protein (porin) [Candidatus Regiella insecticola 5.15]|uniref:Outer membrane protein (Porin) n=1 Tax=Candidatus Regiella insecticola 5.15 TaxID=1005043 RepID=G2GXM2_9ENTR|nr:porin [Candidatus Regiella insecticola]EGY29510.1 Outer membrane protein (porin) [Candidatus Regiella insecticola 5.15]